jgi:hypothetical protein
MPYHTRGGYTFCKIGEGLKDAVRKINSLKEFIQQEDAYRKSHQGRCEIRNIKARVARRIKHSRPKELQAKLKRISRRATRLCEADPPLRHFVIKAATPSLNDLLGHRPAHLANMHYRKEWSKIILANMGRGGFGKDWIPRRVELDVVVYTMRGKRDTDNLYGGLKPVIDAFRAMGWLHDDSQEWLTLGASIYKQSREGFLTPTTCIQWKYCSAIDSPLAPDHEAHLQKIASLANFWKSRLKLTEPRDNPMDEPPPQASLESPPPQPS